jgi:hypothetical protein
MNHSKKQFNDAILTKLNAQMFWLKAYSGLTGGALNERIEVLESAIKQHKTMAENDAEEERMEALRGECGMAPGRGEK